MTTEHRLRNNIKNLLGLGITQRKLAEELVVSETWLSRWVRGEKVRAMSVTEMDRFHAYIAKLKAELGSDAQETKGDSAADAPAGNTFSGDPGRAKTGTDQR
jgi:transcriptional regulator with XRE-family HTH domain